MHQQDCIFLFRDKRVYYKQESKGQKLIQYKYAFSAFDDLRRFFQSWNFWLHTCISFDNNTRNIFQAQITFHAHIKVKCFYFLF